MNRNSRNAPARTAMIYKFDQWGSNRLAVARTNPISTTLTPKNLTGLAAAATRVEVYPPIPRVERHMLDEREYIRTFGYC